MDAPENDPGVKNIMFSQVFPPRRKMIFHFDFSDDWFFLITCTAVKESSAKRRFKKVLSTQSSPPVQYPDHEEDDQ
jgi:predicted sugar kinase